MPALKDKVGHRIGRLTVICRGKNIGKEVGWVCVCDCGTRKHVAANALKIGHTVSCGCHRREQSARMLRALNLSHGQSNTKLHAVWREMRYRCRTATATAYPRYGGRGINVCSEWDKFEAFAAWANANGYDEALTIDRKDNDGDYTPENCRWADMETQSNNKSNNHRLTHHGETLTVSQWARKLGLNVATVFSRIRSGLPINDILKT